MSLLLGVAPSNQAAEVTYDFSDNPFQPFENLRYFGNHRADCWKAAGGNPQGYLELTPATVNKGSTIVFPELDPGQLVTYFKFTCGVRSR